MIYRLADTIHIPSLGVRFVHLINWPDRLMEWDRLESNPFNFNLWYNNHKEKIVIITLEEAVDILPLTPLEVARLKLL